MNPLEGMQKVEAAHEAGCLRFDGAIRGWRCPMAQDDLVGNAYGALGGMGRRP